MSVLIFRIRGNVILNTGPSFGDMKYTSRISCMQAKKYNLCMDFKVVVDKNEPDCARSFWNMFMGIGVKLGSVGAAARNLASSTRNLSKSLPCFPLPPFLSDPVCCCFGANFATIAARFAACWTIMQASPPQSRHLLREARLPSHPHLQPQRGVCGPVKTPSYCYFFQTIPTSIDGITNTNTCSNLTQNPGQKHNSHYFQK